MIATAASGRALYDHWAKFYDDLVGEAGFIHIWPAFRRARRFHGIQFAAAADFGCGTGRFLAALRHAAPAAMLIGIDRSTGMLDVAACRLAGTGTTLLLGDICLITLPERVDLITCNFATINYLRSKSRLQSAFANFTRHLKRGGHLVLDFLSPGEGWEHTTAIVQKISLPGMRGSWELRKCNKNMKGQVMMRNCLRGEQGWFCWQEKHVQRWWPIADIQACLSKAGAVPLSLEPLGGIPPSRGGRWVQLVAQRI